MAKPKIAVFSGPDATIANSNPRPQAISMRRMGSNPQETLDRAREPGKGW